jgi:hypothetical protein
LWHSPNLAAKRHEARAKGGEHRANSYRALEAMSPTLRVVLTRLLTALDETSNGTMKPQVASAVASLSSVIVKVHEASVTEAQMAEVEKRLATLEEMRAHGPTQPLGLVQGRQRRGHE